MSGAAPIPAHGELLALVRRVDPASRGRLIEGILQLCSRGDAPPPAILGELLADLARQAEREIRKILADRLATAEWAPKALVNILALDEIEIAHPIITASPVLSDDDLIAILKRAAEEHRLAVARRAELGERVVGEILHAAEPAVMTALASNPTARIDEAAMARLVEASAGIMSLQAPLAGHPRLSAALGARLYGWIGEGLRAGITERFKIDPVQLEAALGDAVRAAQSAPQLNPGPKTAEEDESTLVALVEKLSAAGQLRQSYLFKALREGQLQLFHIALAHLTELKPNDIRHAAIADDPEPLALACAATGMDQAVFLRLLEILRDLNGGLPGGGAEGARRALGAFGHFTPSAAHAAFRQLAAV